MSKFFRSTLVFLLTLLNLCITGLKAHDCIHEQLVDSPDFEFQFTTTPSSSSGRSLSSSSYSSIRITFDTSGIDSSTTLSTTNRELLLSTIFPRAEAWLESALKVIPISTNLVLPSTSCYKATIDTKYTTTGYQNTDVVIVATAEEDNSSALAWAVPCILEGQTGRPVAGQINIIPSQMENVDIETAVAVVIHEVTHVMVFSSGLYEHFIDRDSGDVLGLENVINERVIDGITETLFVLPTVLKKARGHFCCQEMDGLLLENQGGGSSNGVHFETRIMWNELMSAGAETWNQYSDITLALFYDSGWYDVDYSKADNFLYGKCEGCDFVKGPCLKAGTTPTTDWPEYFCTEHNEAVCSFNHVLRGVCQIGSYSSDLPPSWQYWSENPAYGGVDKFTDYCPIITIFSEGYFPDCTQEANWSSQGSTIINQGRGDQRGETSRCFTGRFHYREATVGYQTTSWLDITRSSCHSVDCDNGRLYIQINDFRVECPVEGGDVVMDNSRVEGTIKCPAYDVLCPLYNMRGEIIDSGETQEETTDPGDTNSKEEDDKSSENNPDGGEKDEDSKDSDTKDDSSPDGADPEDEDSNDNPTDDSSQDQDGKVEDGTNDDSKDVQDAPKDGDSKDGSADENPQDQDPGDDQSTNSQEDPNDENTDGSQDNGSQDDQPKDSNPEDSAQDDETKNDSSQDNDPKNDHSKEEDSQEEIEEQCIPQEGYQLRQLDTSESFIDVSVGPFTAGSASFLATKILLELSNLDAMAYTYHTTYGSSKTNIDSTPIREGSQSSDKIILYIDASLVDTQQCTQICTSSTTTLYECRFQITAGHCSFSAATSENVLLVDRSIFFAYSSSSSRFFMYNYISNSTQQTTSPCQTKPSSYAQSTPITTTNDTNEPTFSPKSPVKMSLQLPDYNPHRGDTIIISTAKQLTNSPNSSIMDPNDIEITTSGSSISVIFDVKVPISFTLFMSGTVTEGQNDVLRRVLAAGDVYEWYTTYYVRVDDSGDGEEGSDGGDEFPLVYVGIGGGLLVVLGVVGCVWRRRVGFKRRMRREAYGNPGEGAQRVQSCVGVGGLGF